MAGAEDNLQALPEAEGAGADPDALRASLLLDELRQKRAKVQEVCPLLLHARPVSRIVAGGRLEGVEKLTLPLSLLRRP